MKASDKERKIVEKRVDDIELWDIEQDKTTLSGLIDILVKIKSQHGDCKLTFDDNYGEDGYTSINFIKERLETDDEYNKRLTDLRIEEYKRLAQQLRNVEAEISSVNAEMEMLQQPLDVVMKLFIYRLERLNNQSNEIRKQIEELNNETTS